MLCVKMAHLFATPGIWESLTTLTIIEDNFKSREYSICITKSHKQKATLKGVRLRKWKKLLRKWIRPQTVFLLSLILCCVWQNNKVCHPSKEKKWNLFLSHHFFIEWMSVTAEVPKDFLHQQQVQLFGGDAADAKSITS